MDTHGIARLPYYLSRLEAGSTEAQPAIVLEITGAGTASLDGGHGLGIVVAHRAMDEAIAWATKPASVSSAVVIPRIVVRWVCTVERRHRPD